MSIRSVIKDRFVVCTVGLMLLTLAGAMGASLAPKVPFQTQLELSHVALVLVALGLFSLAIYFSKNAAELLHRGMLIGLASGFGAVVGISLLRLVSPHLAGRVLHAVHGNYVVLFASAFMAGVFITLLAGIISNSGFFQVAWRPLNLSLYRIVLFATVFFDIDHDANPDLVLFFADLPKDLQVPPPGLAPLLAHLPINIALATAALWGIKIFSFLALIGFFTRTSAWLAVLCMLYGLGIPQFYGQVNHYHHMIWFAAILASCRCADVLSVDAWLASRKRAAAGLTEPPGESRAYAVPLRFVWILLGMIYFFPGFWKYWHSGFDWAFSANFKHQLHLKWMQRDGWLPPIRIDQYPALYMPAALTALVWELGFLPAVFFRPTRIIVAVIGAMFHLGTRVLMHISFWTLQTSYLSLFNWDGIFRKLGTKIYRKPMVFEYDGGNALVRKRVAFWRTLDVFFGRVEYKDVRHGEPVRAIVGDDTFTGDDAWARLATRIPPLWVMIPFVPILRKPTAGEEDAIVPRVARIHPAWRTLGPVIACFSVLIAGNLVFGYKANRTGYPFTCYPPFSRDPGAEARVVKVEAFDANGNQIHWDELKLKRMFSSARYVSLVKNLRETRNEKRMAAFAKVMHTEIPELDKAVHFKFYESVYDTDPSEFGKPPKRSELVYQYSETSRNVPSDNVAPEPELPVAETITSTDSPSDDEMVDPDSE